MLLVVAWRVRLGAIRGLSGIVTGALSAQVLCDVDGSDLQSEEEELGML